MSALGMLLAVWQLTVVLALGARVVTRRPIWSPRWRLLLASGSLAFSATSWDVGVQLYIWIGGFITGAVLFSLVLDRSAVRLLRAAHRPHELFHDPH